MKPRVGLTVFTSSFIILFTIVVFPALSRPLPMFVSKLLRWGSKFPHSIKILISLSFSLAFRRIDSILSVHYFVVGKKDRGLRQQHHKKVHCRDHVINNVPFSITCQIYPSCYTISCKRVNGSVMAVDALQNLPILFNLILGPARTTCNQSSNCTLEGRSSPARMQDTSTRCCYLD